VTVRLLVVGGGISGLAAAWEAATAADQGEPVDVTVLEAADRWGGKIRTSEVVLPDGTALRIDEGPDAFLARVPDAVQLCAELGLTDELTEPAIGRAKVLAGEQLRHLPTQTVLGVPLDADELAATGILSADGVERVRAEPGLDLPPPEHDVAIGELLADRFGRELVDRLVGPLIGGINAGDVDALSLHAVTPQLAEAASDGGSLSAALQRRRAAAPSAGPVFHTLLDGTQRLVDVLVEQLEPRGVSLHAGVEVRELIRTDEGGLAADVVATGTGSTAGTGAPEESERLEADRVVLATPAPAAAQLLAGLSADAVAELRSITHSSVVLVTLVYDRDQLAGLQDGELDASGFLVPRHAGRFVTAVSYGTSKWAHWDDGRHVVLRASAGHVHDTRPLEMEDDQILWSVVEDLRATMGLHAEPLAARVSRYPLGFAQYEVGHLDRVARIEAALARDVPNLRVAGAAYRGVGIPACIRQGRAAARALLPADRA
jgi:oxygen-dependent protoporphyrinogen oxidase